MLSCHWHGIMFFSDSELWLGTCLSLLLSAASPPFTTLLLDQYCARLITNIDPSSIWLLLVKLCFHGTHLPVKNLSVQPLVQSILHKLHVGLVLVMHFIWWTNLTCCPFRQTRRSPTWMYFFLSLDDIRAVAICQLHTRGTTLPETWVGSRFSVKRTPQAISSGSERSDFSQRKGGL